MFFIEKYYYLPHKPLSLGPLKLHSLKTYDFPKALSHSTPLEILCLETVLRFSFSRLSDTHIITV